MKSFSTYGCVRPEQHYIVSRTEEVADFISRIKAGRYVVLFAPRQTGKTAFFRLALDALATQDSPYFPIQLDFQIMRDAAPPVFYEQLYTHNQRKYIVETKIGRGNHGYQTGKRQLAAYLKLEGMEF
ncbi:hypothetical protein F4X88_08445 [Candidatus Poribacteria bacterium]|nr:hypothetical protein [Candidatus Poribacteria bacterium]MYA56308.1 hypothetical protein [Candidatus Poribacteria bacterium]